MATVVSRLAATVTAPCAGGRRIDHARMRSTFAMDAKLVRVGASEWPAVDRIVTVVYRITANVAEFSAGDRRIHDAAATVTRAALVGATQTARQTGRTLAALHRATALGVGHETAIRVELGASRGSAHATIRRSRAGTTTVGFDTTADLPRRA